MISGNTTRKIRTEIRSILEGCSSFQSAWGFGSYFRGEAFKDVDILVVVDCERDKLLFLTRQLKAEVLNLERELGMIFDLLILTVREFAQRPLRDMDQMVLLYRRPAVD
ncbi:nucleotidyltransferase domain-containing protein [Mesorhizobium captivum]|uniref:nucleotidyltransferase domain-containing protein n=1 Tax=Mesorhizobium captivum TaxID=3072319 RepID=UPI003D6A5560